MLRGLVIRQAFVVVEMVLVLLTVAGAGYAVTHLYGSAWKGGGPESEAEPGLPEAPGGALAEVKPRSEYDRIVATGLFGLAGRTALDQPTTAPPEPEETETQLRLKLVGTAATSPRDLLATAVILNEEKNVVRTFAVGQQVVDNVTLEQVFPRRVILYNKPANRREVLRTEETANQSAKGAPGPPAAPHSAFSGTSGRVSVKKTELVQELFANYADIVTQVKPELYRDASGKVAGITASNLESVPVAKTLNLKNGDVLQTVNNEMIDSEEKIMELVNKYQNSNTFRIGILRDGKPMTITYKLD
jgi:general secretion pathway protein C